MNLATLINDVAFTSEISEVAIITNESGEIKVRLKDGFAVFLETVHEPIENHVVIYDLRQVIEQYMIAKNLQNFLCTISAEQNGSEVQLKETNLIFASHRVTVACNEFIEDNFLSLIKAKLCNKKHTEWLSFFCLNVNDKNVNVSAKVMSSGEMVTKLTNFSLQTATDAVNSFPVSYKDLAQRLQLENEESMMQADITLGNRVFTLFFQDEIGDVNIVFRNAFNCFEACSLDAVITHLPKATRNLASVHGKSIQYGLINEESFEVQADGIMNEQAVWLKQMVFSHDVRLGNNVVPDSLPKILITDFDFEVTDSDTEMNKLKFSFQREDASPILEVMTVSSYKRFNEKFNDKFY